MSDQPKVLGLIISVEPVFPSLFLYHHAFVEQKLQEFFEFGLPIRLPYDLSISLFECHDKFAIGQDFTQRKGLYQCFTMFGVA